MPARRRAALFAIALLPVLRSHAAVHLSAADGQKIRALVRAQLAAFAAGRAAQAFAFATTALQAQFGTAEKFMAMVRMAYPVVYAPASVAFLIAEADGDGAVQRVQMTDRQGKAWLVVYDLQREKDGSWRISACLVTPSRGRFA